jgi:hypothetical protein
VGIAEVLSRFNRKERDWLVKNAIAEGTLSLEFRQRLEDALGPSLPLEGIPEDAWWAMDYHLDWLAAALWLYTHPESDNTWKPRGELIKSTHEDVDLIIAFDTTIILIEAKGVRAWDNAQMDRKVKRLLGLGLQPDGSLETASGVRLLFALASPRPPKSLRMTGYHFALDEVPYLPLVPIQPDGIFKRVVTDGESWRIEDQVIKCSCSP